MPQTVLAETHETFSRENIVRLCMDSLRSVLDWDYLIQRQIANGKTLELAWCLEMGLDWVWQEQCVDGTERYWAVLCGLALKQVGTVTCICRDHYRVMLTLSNRTLARHILRFV